MSLAGPEAVDHNAGDSCIEGTSMGGREGGCIIFHGVFFRKVGG